jgi:hypothetical protein
MQSMHSSALGGYTMKFLSPIISDARASLGGATFSKNRGGNFARARVAPVQPRTSAQQAARASLSTLSSLWRGLTATQQAGWTSLAASIITKNSLGVSYTPTGSQLYVQCNRVLNTIGQATISAPPALVPSFADMLPIAATATAGTPTFAVTTSLGAAPTGFVFLVRATPQSSAGRSFFGQSQYRVIANYPSSSFASLNILAAYTARFGTLAAGRKIAVSVSLVQTSSGLESVPAYTTVVVGA